MVCLKTKQLLGTLKMNTDAVSVAFTPGFLWSLGVDGVVYQWDLKERKCVHRFNDHGCVRATKIQISPDYSTIAIGSSMGVVNVYDTSKVVKSSHPEPEKAILNLTTSISEISFHPSSQMLAIASNQVKDSMRLYHLPSKKVVKTWPTNQTPLGYVSKISFSPNGQYIAIGNDKGKVLLYRFETFQ
jgi:U3 small nucleolar RNA-associated protein 18